jgi:dihydrofolate synthase / folylpolyglutamate synthase
METYSSLISKLFQVNLFGGMKLGLENCLRLAQALNFPEKQFTSIHVAGSNGKGSVTTKIAKACEYSGLKVGLYTSPHISTFRERIRINGQMIPEEQVVEGLSLIFKTIENEKIPATFFEITTFLAFWYFAKQKVDLGVIEAGLGGRLDATNILNPQLCIITSISLEHTEILGNTLEEIAYEKAGIIKKGIPILIGPKVPVNIMEAVANEKESPLISMQEHFPSFELENRSIALKALEWLKISPAAIEKGLQATPECRLQEIWHQKQLVILDVAHNPDGFEHLFQALHLRYPNMRFRVLFGLSKTKDIQHCLSILIKNSTRFYPVEAPNGRGLPALEIKELLIKLGVSLDAISLHPTIQESLEKSLEENTENEILVICGTFFIMSDVRIKLGLNDTQDFIDMNERHTKNWITTKLAT